MIHNGIEYGDMQMICEAYDVMRQVLGMEPAEMAEVFAEWNGGELDSYLIEITAEILAKKRRRKRQANDRPDWRCSRSKRDRQMDGHRRTQVGAVAGGHNGGRLRSQSLRP